MKNLAEVPKSEQLDFINSFDHVLSDLDGVIWMLYQPIPGASECINALKQRGKKIHYVSNNSTTPRELVKKKLDDHGLITELDDIMLPIIAIIAYLKKINFNKELYVIGMITIREALKQAGFLITDGPQEIQETIQSVLVNISDNKNIAGVVIEVDMNMNYIKLQKAITYLSRKECIFVIGPGDAKLPMPRGPPLIGPHYFLKPIIDITAREPYQLAKPDVNYNEFIVDSFKITDKNRVLFIGDSIPEDLNFATKCGYKKLLVLTGITKKEQLSEWTYPEEYKPHYYVESLAVFKQIIEDCL